MKCETCFVALKSEMHTFITKENHESKKGKSIYKNVIDDDLVHDYKNVLFNRS